MNSRPLLDYLAYPDHYAEARASERAPADRQEAVQPAPVEALETRLKDLAARLRANMPSASASSRDLTLSAQIEAILNRKIPQPAEPHTARSMQNAIQPASSRARLVVDPPPSAPVIASGATIDPEFAKFSEAVYLIGQAARRFVDESPAAPAATPQPAPAMPSTAEIDALSAVLRETVSAFRSVADDLAVSAGEIRSFATRGVRTPKVPDIAAGDGRNDISGLQETIAAFGSIARELSASVNDIRAAARHDDRQPLIPRDRRDRLRDEEDEIHDLRDTVTDLQDRLDALLRARRRARY